VFVCSGRHRASHVSDNHVTLYGVGRPVLEADGGPLLDVGRGDVIVYDVVLEGSAWPVVRNAGRDAIFLLRTAVRDAVVDGAPLIDGGLGALRLQEADVTGNVARGAPLVVGEGELLLAYSVESGNAAAKVTGLTLTGNAVAGATLRLTGVTGVVDLLDITPAPGEAGPRVVKVVGGDVGRTGHTRPPPG
jgi:hypothetical protein